MGIPFDVLVLKDIDESYPADLPAAEVAEYIACKKAAAYDVPHIEEASADHSDIIVITADTVVVCDDAILGKPKDEDDAYRMLRQLSGKSHQVYTGVCISTAKEQRHFSVATDVTFKELSDEEIWHYIREYKPFDKAGAYGIQEWIGYIGITGIKGSYYNVMGFPVQRVYQELTKMTE